MEFTRGAGPPAAAPPARPRAAPRAAHADGSDDRVGTWALAAGLMTPTNAIAALRSEYRDLYLYRAVCIYGNEREPNCAGPQSFESIRLHA